MPPWKVQSILSIEMAHYCKLFLRFAAPFWDNIETIPFAANERGAWQNLWTELASPRGDCGGSGASSAPTLFRVDAMGGQGPASLLQHARDVAVAGSCCHVGCSLVVAAEE